MIHKILGILLLTPALVRNVDSIRPDVSYTGDNDRFDLAAVVRASNRMNRDIPFIDDGERRKMASEKSYRRQLQNEDTETLHLSEVIKKKPQTIIFITRRSKEAAPYDPDEVRKIGRAGTDNMVDLDFEENLKQFMSLPKASRRKLLNSDEFADN